MKDLLTKAMFIYKCAMDKKSRLHGGSVQYINQHSLIWGISSQINPMGGHTKGVCHGLAVEWLKAVSKGEDFIHALGNARNQLFADSKNLNSQTDSFFRTINDSHSQQNRDPEIDEKLLLTALEKVGKKVDKKAFKFPFTNAKSFLENGFFYFISTGSHAMAATSDRKSFEWNGKVTFYDPNVGLLTGTSKAFLEDYLKECVVETCNLAGGNPSEKSLTITKFKYI